MMAILTNHAHKRCQQRGISQSVIDIIISKGVEVDEDNEAITLALSKKDKKRVLKELKQCIHTLEKEPYIVLGNNGSVITTAHKFH